VLPRDHGEMETTEAAPGEVPAARPSSRSRWWWATRAFLALGALFVLYVGITFVQVWRASTRDTARPSDAIVVLGAAQYDGRPSPVLKARLDRAYELYDEGLAPLVVTTGANQEGDRFTEGFVGFDYLRGRGVPEKDLLVVTDGVNTWEELSATAHQLELRGLDSVVLVSDGYHALRLEHTAEELGLDASVARTDGSASMRELVRETAGVALGRVIGYRRLASLT
jgi:uncharacterized SAM-binding protein YcdF (DUF218 family)